MADVPTLQARLDQLRKVRANGILRLSVDGQDTWFKSDADMASAIADLERQIAAASPRPPPRALRIHSSKGV